MNASATTLLRRVASCAAAFGCSAALLTGTAAPAAATPIIHTTDLPSSEPTVTLAWSPASAGHIHLQASIASTANRHLRVQRSWSCPGDTGAARVAHATFHNGSINLTNANTAVQAIQTTCSNPTPAPMLTVIVTRSGDSAAVTHVINPAASGQWTNSAAPFQTYSSSQYGGETCTKTGANAWTVSDSFTLTGGTYELLDASTTGNGNPDITPELTNTPIGYNGATNTITFVIHNVYPYDPSGQTLSYRICPNQGEAYVDVDFAFPDGSYAGEWELTHAWPTSIPSCG